MARDFWQTIRAAIKVDKIKKSLTIPAASYPTFRRHGCLEYDAADNNDNRFSSSLATGTALTTEIYVKPESAAATKQTILKLGDDAVTPELEISLLNNVLTVKVWKGGVTTSITATGYLTPYSWTQVAVTYDNVTLKLFVNGVKVSSTALAGPLDVQSLFCRVCQTNAGVEQFIGKIAEIRIWSVARTEEQILSFYRNPRNVGMDDVTGLVDYYKCNGVLVDGTGREKNQVTPSQFINASQTKLISTDSPPLIFGASFAAAEFPVVLTEPISFQFPVPIPDGCTGMLVARWIETDGTVQRRRFWDLEGVDIHPFPDVYDGEAIHVPFALEWWNVDGAETIEVPDDITLRISKCTKPTSSYDSTAVSAATLTEDTTLGEPYPLTYPLTFNTAQSYT